MTARKKVPIRLRGEGLRVEARTSDGIWFVPFNEAERKAHDKFVKEFHAKMGRVKVS